MQPAAVQVLLEVVRQAQVQVPLEVVRLAQALLEAALPARQLHQAVPVLLLEGNVIGTARFTHFALTHHPAGATKIIKAVLLVALAHRNRLRLA